MILSLERFAYTPVGTFGRLRLPEFECFTVECPWLNNEPWISCIPEGSYQLAWGRYNRGGYDTYEVLDVPGRSLIKFHVGNTMDDLRGCIGPGRGLGWIKRRWAVTDSGVAFADFIAALEPPADAPERRHQHRLEVTQFEP